MSIELISETLMWLLYVPVGAAIVAVGCYVVWLIPTVFLALFGKVDWRDALAVVWLRNWWRK